jgi:hypothetical protein
MPWKCPDCSTWIAPEVKEHRCGDDGHHAAPCPWPHYPPAPFAPGFFMQPPWVRCAGCGVWFVGHHACWTYMPWAGGMIVSGTTTVTSGGIASSSTYFVT